MRHILGTQTKGDAVTAEATNVDEFDAAVKDVENVIEQYDKSDKAKNKALYAALDQAFKFHRKWHGSSQYGNMLKQRKISAKPRGKNASIFLPTIKAFFDPDLDAFKPSDDAEKADKSRRQKTVSTYSKVLKYAASSDDAAKDVAAFIVSKGGIAQACAAWTKDQADSEQGKAAEEERKNQKKARLRAVLEGLKGTMTKELPTLPNKKGRAAIGVLFFDDNGIGHVMQVVEDDSLLHRLLTKQGKEETVGAALEPVAATAITEAEQLEQAIGRLEALAAKAPVTGAMAKQALGRLYGEWQTAYKYVKEKNSAVFEPILSQDAQLMMKKSLEARLMWGRASVSKSKGHERAAERKSEEVHELWGCLTESDKAAFDLDETTPPGVPVPNWKKPRATQQQNQAEAVDVCLKNLRSRLAELRGEAKPVRQDERAAVQAATERLKRLQAVAGKGIPTLGTGKAP